MNILPHRFLYHYLGKGVFPKYNDVAKCWHCGRCDVVLNEKATFCWSCYASQDWRTAFPSFRQEYRERRVRVLEFKLMQTLRCLEVADMCRWVVLRRRLERRVFLYRKLNSKKEWSVI
jgi:hypothetical protein